MTAPNEALREQLGYFHALSKVSTNITQEVYESLYKSAHSTRGADLWASSVAVAADSTAADSEASSNNAVTKFGTTSVPLELTQVSGSNGQAYYLEDTGTFIRPWIAPTDVPNPTTNAPSDGYQARLYQGTTGSSPGTEITPTEGTWVFDYYAGLVIFQQGSTPSDQGWGTPKIMCYQYSGDTLQDALDNTVANNFVENENLSSQADGTATVFTVASSYVAGSIKVYHNGLRALKDTDYNETDSTSFTFTDIPDSSDTIVVDYRV